MISGNWISCWTQLTTMLNKGRSLNRYKTNHHRMLFKVVVLFVGLLMSTAIKYQNFTVIINIRLSKQQESCERVAIAQFQRRIHPFNRESSFYIMASTLDIFNLSYDRYESIGSLKKGEGRSYALPKLKGSKCRWSKLF